MPVHNGGNYLATAVNSILEQYDVLLELILIDDHSTDNAIAELSPDPRLRIIVNSGTGIVAALNSGLTQAKYPYIARMDGDDIALPTRLISQLTYLVETPDVDICGARVEIFTDGGRVKDGYSHYQEWINQLCSHEKIAANIFIESPMPHPTIMMHTSLLIELGGYQNTTWAEDYDLWCRAFIQGKRFGKPDTLPLLKWRDYDTRTSRVQARYSKQQFLQCKAKYLSHYLQHHNISCCEIWGTGPTGLKLHDYLQKNGIYTRRFVDVNPKLNGRKKRGKMISIVGQTLNDQQVTNISGMIIVAVGTRGARELIQHTLRKAGLKETRDFIFAA